MTAQDNAGYYAERIKRAEKIEGFKEGFKYVMAEQVCLVGEPA